MADPTMRVMRQLKMVDELADAKLGHKASRTTMEGAKVKS